MILVGTAGVPKSTSSRDSISGVTKVKSLGLDAMELEFVRGVHMGEETAVKVYEVAGQHSISLSVHAPYFINLASKEQHKIDASIERIVKSAVIGYTAGAKTVVFHAGFYTGRTEREAYNLIFDGVRKAREKLDDMNIDIVLGPETMGKAKQFGKIGELVDLCSNLSGVFPVIDWCHLHAIRDGGLKDVDDFIDVIEIFKNKLSQNYFHMHFSGVEYSNGNEKRHIPISENEPDYSLLAKALVETNIDGTLICESPLQEDDALLFKRMLKEEMDNQ